MPLSIFTSVPLRLLCEVPEKSADTRGFFTPKEINLGVAKKFGVQVIEQETGLDHIHILFASKPQVQLSKFVKSLKSVSARLLFREFPDLKKDMWNIN